MEGITVDLKTNTITVAADNYEVVQNLALVFSIAVLQVEPSSVLSHVEPENHTLQISHEMRRNHPNFKGYSL